MARPTSVNVQDLRASNRARVLTTVYLHGPLTRQEIGEAAGVSPATVSNLAGDLLERGVLLEAGAEDSGGGRPRALLAVNPHHGHVIGVDVGETAVLVELFDLGMQVLASLTLRPVSRGLDPEQTAARVLEGLRRVTGEYAPASGSILGVGVGMPGLVEHGDDAVVDAPTIGWDRVPFGELLRRGTDLPLLVDNGAATFGRAEKWFGAARKSDNAIVVLLGTGVGVSIFTEGELYRGASSSAGEWGHTTAVTGGRRCRCGAKGCLEAYIGGLAIGDRYDELAGRSRRRSGEDVLSRISAVAAAPRSDKAAATVLRETATYLGYGIANLVNLFNPRQIVVGGWVADLLGERLLGPVRAVVGRQALRLPYDAVSIDPAQLGRHAVALGAATLPVHQFLSSGGAPAITAKPRQPAVQQTTRGHRRLTGSVG